MVDVLHAGLGLHPVEPHRLELEHHQGAEHVLQQGLVDAQGDLATGRHLAVDEMIAN